jgi:hypothetical protein
MFLLLAVAFGALVYAPLVTLMVVRLRAQNARLQAERRQLRAERGLLRAENAALEQAVEHQALSALARNAAPHVLLMLPPAERLSYMFAFRRNLRGTPPGSA